MAVAIFSSGEKMLSKKKHYFFAGLIQENQKAFQTTQGLPRLHRRHPSESWDPGPPLHKDTGSQLSLG
jgi:hypothetical protein